MSSASVTSSKREKAASDLTQEIESIRAMNSSLQAYLDYLKVLRSNLVAMNDNCIQLNKVNKEWVEALDKNK